MASFMDTIPNETENRAGAEIESVCGPGES